MGHDYQAFQRDLQSSNSGLGGLYGSNDYSITGIEKMFNGAQSSGLTIIQADYAIFNEDAISEIILDNETCNNVNALGPDYSDPVSIEMCDRFMSYYGIWVVLKNKMGGKIEQNTCWNTQYIQNNSINEATMQNNGMVDFVSNTKIGSMPSKPQSPLY